MVGSMEQTFFASILATGFVVAFAHAALPTHWLPFVLAARGQGWSRGRALTITALAGAGHILFTIVLGVLLVALGLQISRAAGEIFPLIAGGLLIVIGLFYLYRQVRGLHHSHGHHHHGHGHGHDHDETHDAPPPAGRRADRAVIVSLLALLTFSPCEGFLPVYLSGIAYGWLGFLALSLVLATATLAGMVILTWITLAGFQRLRLHALERVENGVLGAMLCLLGIALVWIERGAA
jgi:ABC-type nickel/cobalt efflux system permease component RcnA